MSEWKEYKLGDLCSKIGSGATPSGGKEAYKGGNFSLVRSQNVLDFSFSYDGLARINDLQAKKLANVELKECDVLLNITGDSVARACMVPTDILPARVNQHVAILRANNDVLDSDFLLYHLQKQKKLLLQYASAGATRNALTKGMIEDLIIKLPPIDEQKRIASILSSLDDKIAVNRRICENLEAQAQALFKHWFVDFAPFKDGKFVESELGLIPEGWRVGTLSDLGEIVCGKTPAKANKAYYGNEIPFIKIPDMHNNLFIIRSEDNLSIEGSESQINKLLPEFSILVSCIATVGLVSINTSPAHTNQQINSIIPFDIRYRYYLYEYLKLQEKYLLVLGSSGTTTFNVNTKTFSNIRIVIPNIETFDNFHNLVFQSFDEILNRSKESSRLASLRDTLLPKLMSGEIKV